MSFRWLLWIGRSIFFGTAIVIVFCLVLEAGWDDFIDGNTRKGSDLVEKLE